ncbi:hypothetical protein [Acidovorax sp. JHL-9]|uniref:hypothetical protein n=1 Tax=Acidovorax sp. JHL-9 TaxID=1276756 RepID=UPI00138ACA36|nr:hypothetical protein [Acidovorax sp. JHL-9]
MITDAIRLSDIPEQSRSFESSFGRQLAQLFCRCRARLERRFQPRHHLEFSRRGN